MYEFLSRIAAVIVVAGVALAAPPALALGTCGAAGGGPAPDGDEDALLELCDTGDEPASHPPVQPGTHAGNPVDVVTGNKYRRELDVAWPGVQWRGQGLSLVFSRHYNSANDFDGVLGRGWSHGFETRIVRPAAAIAARQLQVIQGDGRRIVFGQTGARRVFRALLPSFGQVTETLAGEGRPGFVWQWRDGRVLEFDADGRLVAIVARDADRIALARDVDGRLLSIMLSGLSLELDYARGRLVAVRTPEGATLRYRYDLHGQLAAVTYPDGTELSYRYDDPRAFHRLTSVGGRDGSTLAEYAYDDQGRAVRSVAAGAASVDLEYAPPSSPEALGSTRLASAGRYTVYRWRYDARRHDARILAATGPGCSGCPASPRRFEYDANGLTVEESVPGANGEPLVRRRLTRDQQGRITRLLEERRRGSRSDRISLRLDYDPASPLALPIQVVRDSIAAGSQHRVRIRYNARGQPLSIDEIGWQKRIDKAALQPSQRSQRRLPERVPERASYERMHRRIGWRYHETGPLLGLPIARDGPLPGDTDAFLFRHDPASRRLVAIELPERLELRFEHDRFGRRTEAVDADGVRTWVGYEDPVRRYAPVPLVRERRVGEHVMRYDWDAAGRLTAIRTSGGASLRVERGPGGVLVSLADGNGWRADRATARHSKSPSGTGPGESFAAANSGAGAVHPPGEVPHASFDDFDRPILLRLPEHGDQRARYDAQDRIVAIDYADGSGIDYAYDALGRLIAKSTREADGSVTTAAIRRRGARLVAVDDPVQATSWEYDTNGRRVGIRTRIAGLEHWRGIELDASGRVVRQRLASGVTLSYLRRGDDGTLDAISFGDGSRVIDESALSRVVAAMTRAPLARVGNAVDSGGPAVTPGAVDPSPPEYDARGRLRRIGTRSFDYDALGRLVAVHEGTRPLAHYRYNAFGERTLADRGGRRAIVLHDRGRPDAVIDDGITEYVDLRGVPVAVLRGGHAATPDAQLLRARLTGRELDAATGLVYNRHRWIEPRLGRYLTPDPLGYPDGRDPYRVSRAGSNVDPLGLYEIDVHYYLTFFLARIGGLPPRLAKTIAAAAQFIDDNPLTRPESPLNLRARTLYHFTHESDERANDWRQPWNRQLHRLHRAARDPLLVPCQQAQLYGEFLHAFQDSYAHRHPDGTPFAPWIGHLRYGHDPDQTYDVRNSLGSRIDARATPSPSDPHRRLIAAFPDFLDNAERALTMEQTVFELFRSDWGRASPYGFDDVRQTLIDFNSAGQREYEAYLRANTHTESAAAYLLRKRGEWEYKVAILDRRLIELGLGGFGMSYSDERGNLFDLRYDPGHAAQTRTTLLSRLDHGPPDRFAGVLLPRERR